MVWTSHSSVYYFQSASGVWRRWFVLCAIEKTSRWHVTEKTPDSLLSQVLHLLHFSIRHNPEPAAGWNDWGGYVRFWWVHNQQHTQTGLALLRQFFKLLLLNATCQSNKLKNHHAMKDLHMWTHLCFWFYIHTVAHDASFNGNRSQITIQS